MSDNPIQVPINFDIDARRANQAVDGLESHLRKARTQLTEMATAAKQSPVGLGTLERTAKSTSLELTRLRNTINSVDDKKVTSAAKQATDSLRKLEVQTEKTQAQLGKGLSSTVSLAPKGTRTTEEIGNFERPLGDVRNALSAFGGNEQSIRALSIGSDIAGAIEGVGKLGVSIKELSKGAIASGITLGGVGIAIAGISFLASESTRKLNLEFAKVDAAIQRTQDLRNELSQLASTQDLARLEDANARRRKQIQQEIADKERLIAESGIAKTRDLLNVDESPFGKPAAALFDLVGARVDDARAKIDELNEELKTLDESSLQAASSLARISIAAKEVASSTAEELALNRRLVEITNRGTLEDLEKFREDVELSRIAIATTRGSREKELEDALTEQLGLVLNLAPEAIAEGLVGTPKEKIEFLLSQLDVLGQEVAPGIQELQDVIADLTKDYEFQGYIIETTLLPAIVGRTEATQQEREAIERVAAEEKELTKARGSALKELQTARQQLADFDKQLATENANREREAGRNIQRTALRQQIEAVKAAEAETERSSRINEARKKADEDARQLDAKFKAEALKAERDFGKERDKIIKDTNRAKQDAELDNNVNAFIAAEQAGADQLSELDQNFQDEQAERQRQHQESLNNLRAQLAEKERTELAARQQGLTRSQQLERQLQALEESFKAEDAKRELALQQQASAARRQILITEVNEARNILRLLQSSAARAAALAGVRQGVNNAASALGNILGNIPSFAKGVEGLDKPIIARIGDAGPGMAEAVVPYRKSEGLGGAMKPNLTLQIYQTVGEHVTRTDIENAKQGVFQALIEAKMIEYAAVS
jgi:hypothetical protein